MGKVVALEIMSLDGYVVKQDNTISRTTPSAACSTGCKTARCPISSRVVPKWHNFIRLIVTRSRSGSFRLNALLPFLLPLCSRIAGMPAQGWTCSLGILCCLFVFVHRRSSRRFSPRGLASVSTSACAIVYARCRQNCRQTVVPMRLRGRLSSRDICLSRRLFAWLLGRCVLRSMLLLPSTLTVCNGLGWTSIMLFVIVRLPRILVRTHADAPVLSHDVWDNRSIFRSRGSLIVCTRFPLAHTGFSTARSSLSTDIHRY